MTSPEMQQRHWNRLAQHDMCLGVARPWLRSSPAPLSAHGWRVIPRVRIRPSVIKAALSTSPAADGKVWCASAATTAAPNPWDAAKLALNVLKPDWPLAAVTAATLAFSIATTLAFPLALGGLFDVVKAQGVSQSVTSAAAPASSPLMMFTAGGAPPTFKTALLSLCICMVLSPIASATVAYLSPLLAERFGARMKKHLLQEVLRKDQAFFDHSAKGGLVSRLTLDVATLQTTLADLCGQRGFRSLLEVLGPMLLIAWKHPIMAVITCAVTPLLSNALRSVVVRSTELSYERQQVAAASLEFASDRLAHVQTVQVFGQEEREAAGFRDLAAQSYAIAKKYALYQGLVEGAGRLAVNVGTVSLLGFGGLLVQQGTLTVGTLLAYMVFNLFISLGLSQLAASLGDVGKAIGALERISDLVTNNDSSLASSDTAAATTSRGGVAGSQAAAAQLLAASQVHAVADTSPRSSAHAPAAPGHAAPGSNGATPGSSNRSSSRNDGVESRELPVPVAVAASTNGALQHAAAETPSGEVELRDVWFRYQGRDDWALKGLSLTIPAGSTLALVGPSGGGKTTVANLILGVYQPEHGEVLVGGRPMRHAADWDGVRQRMAAVLQQPMLMSGTVAQQIAYGRQDASFDEVVAAAEQANADAFIRGLPQGYDTQVGERGHALSGGQKQRLAIARALLCQPQILVLDEVTSALDVESEVAIDTTLCQLEGCTKLVIAHRLTTVRSADRIACVVGGQVAEAGSHEELMGAQGGVYQRLVMASQL